MEFEFRNPPGDVMMVWHLAQVAQAIYNVNRDDKKQPMPYQLGDFILKLKDPDKKPRRMSVEDTDLALRAAFGVLDDGQLSNLSSKSGNEG
jgi:hypothetical protein